MQSFTAHLLSRTTTAVPQIDVYLAKKADCQGSIILPGEALKTSTSPGQNMSASHVSFIWHTLEAASVSEENSHMLTRALRDKGCSFEEPIYPKGRQGLGLNTDFTWFNNCLKQ